MLVLAITRKNVPPKEKEWTGHRGGKKKKRGRGRKKERRKTNPKKDKLGPKLQKERTEKEGKRTQLKRKNERGEKIRTLGQGQKKRKRRWWGRRKTSESDCFELEKVKCVVFLKIDRTNEALWIIWGETGKCEQNLTLIDSIQNLQGNKIIFPAWDRFYNRHTCQEWNI